MREQQKNWNKVTISQQNDQTPERGNDRTRVRKTIDSTLTLFKNLFKNVLSIFKMLEDFEEFSLPHE